MNKYYFAAAASALLLLGIMKKDEIQKKFIGSVTRWDPLFQKYGVLYGVDWTVLKKICYIESTLGLNWRVARGLLNPKDVIGSVSSDGKSWGIMQLRPSTAKDFDASATPEKLNDPDFSIKIAAQYLAWSRRYLEGKLDVKSPDFQKYWIEAYNQGVGNSIKEFGRGLALPYYDKFKGLAV